ncbi:mersacidin/lichenicidin family type 2 lantibiotic [Thermosporothrix hazakensis]|jgi:mersacidin/lichenicidin family type 2 lantibiotic|uniref:Mersacidin/lichenicidin family type 2 lantibiotic n=2 Tax=Thermosporothrix TaxID=768650 RepID=A0A326U5W3_THEHA|nr:mersacidin/lichenicidin family type 2 lantibiotic [Thermosporothrix hazakensis]PZW29341.1 mersacidin/lichenicidin family type 2 lantibiotic [Thermosporothrix hazakensis]BBH86270.1 hypothetical protein KTC_10210 [Thermosporothrix sp. COM3]GCE45308.1 hypothetical protein KTH_01770 [Thermosporothrix hazakensis]
MNNWIARAWKDAIYRKQLTAEERERLPESPVGEVSELQDVELDEATGGHGGYGFVWSDWWRKCRPRRSYYGGCYSKRYDPYGRRCL